MVGGSSARCAAVSSTPVNTQLTCPRGIAEAIPAPSPQGAVTRGPRVAARVSRSTVSSIARPVPGEEELPAASSTQPRAGATLPRPISARIGDLRDIIHETTECLTRFRASIDAVKSDQNWLTHFCVSVQQEVPATSKIYLTFYHYRFGNDLRGNSLSGRF